MYKDDRAQNCEPGRSYRGRGFETHRDRFAFISSNNLEQVIYTHGAQANSAFHPCGVGKWVAISIW